MLRRPIRDREDIRGREEELIGRLYSAIRHYVKTEEGAGSEFENQMVDVADVAGGRAPKKRKRTSTRGQSDAAILRLSPAELQMVCWELLVRSPETLPIEVTSVRFTC